jgi:hypothetical protein
VLHDRLQSVPLLDPRESSLPHDDEPRMQLDVEQIDEIPRVRRHQGEIMLECVMPENRVGLAAEADMGNRHRIDTESCGPLHELGR